MSAPSPLEIEAAILGLKGAAENASKARDVEACDRAARLIRSLAAECVALKAQTYEQHQIIELARGIQIAHAAWLAIGAPGAWEIEPPAVVQCLACGDCPAREGGRYCEACGPEQGERL